MMHVCTLRGLFVWMAPVGAVSSGTYHVQRIVGFKPLKPLSNVLFMPRVFNWASSLLLREKPVSENPAEVPRCEKAVVHRLQ